MFAERPWKPELVMRYLLALFGCIFLGVIAVDLINSHHWLPIDSKYVTLIFGTLSLHGAALLLANALLKAHDMTWTSGFGFASPRLGRSVLLALLVGAAVLPIVWSLAQLSAKLMGLFHLEVVQQESVQMLQKSVPFKLKLLVGILAVIVAPIGEEVIFRGILYQTVKQQGFPRLALWGTSLLFATIHGNAMIFLPLTLLAVILTLLYETTGNLAAPMITHSLFNFANFFWLITSRPGS